MVSHRPEAISALDIAMVLRDGRMVAFGPRQEMFARVARAVKLNATSEFKTENMESGRSPMMRSTPL
jgi:ABC-type protease/lipase transport system fused ATPase/permease subunit